jgi:hypothetical protein
MWPFGLFIGPFAVWFGIKGLRSRSLPGVYISKGGSIAGIILGSIGILAFTAMILLIVVGLNSR